jgi:hypothetical protein
MVTYYSLFTHPEFRFPKPTPLYSKEGKSQFLRFVLLLFLAISHFPSFQKREGRFFARKSGVSENLINTLKKNHDRLLVVDL